MGHKLGKLLDARSLGQYDKKLMNCIRNRYNQVPHLTRDTTWESDKKEMTLHTQ